MTDIHLDCLYCGQAASDHHHEPPLGSGGSKGGAWQGHLVPLCRQHHRGVHDKLWVLEIHDGIARGYTPEGVLLFARPLVLHDIVPLPPVSKFSDFMDSLRLMTDQALAGHYEEILSQRRDQTLYLALIAEVFHERYGHYGGDWAGRTAQYISDQTGWTVYERDIRRFQKLGLFLVLREDFIPLLGDMRKSLMQAIAEADDPDAAVQFCENAKTETGRYPTIRQLEAHLGNEPEMCECMECGNVHRKAKG